MAKKSEAKKTVSKKRERHKDIATVPDAWERFKRAVDAAIKSGPKHRSSPKPSKPNGEKAGGSKSKPQKS